MTSPSSRGAYGGGYYTSAPFADTPIYDSLVAERGTPQIAPIRVPAAYDTGSHLPALPSALPALTSGSPAPLGQQRGGYQQPAPAQHAPLQQAPAPYIPHQPAGDRGGYQQQYPYQQYPQQQPMRPVAPRPAPPRPMSVQQPAPGRYDDPYGRQHPTPGY